MSKKNKTRRVIKDRNQVIKDASARKRKRIINALEFFGIIARKKDSTKALYRKLKTQSEKHSVPMPV